MQNHTLTFENAYVCHSLAGGIVEALPVCSKSWDRAVWDLSGKQQSEEAVKSWAQFVAAGLKSWFFGQKIISDAGGWDKGPWLHLPSSGQKKLQIVKAGFVRFPYVQFIWGQIQLLPPWNRKSIASCSAEHQEHCMSALVKQKRVRMQLAWWIKGREKSLNYEKSTLEEANHMWRTNAGKSPNCLEQMPLLLK